MRWIGIVIALAFIGAAWDLDVGLDPGRPYDFIKTPKEPVPTGGRAGKDTESQAGSDKKPEPGKPGKPGETVAEDTEKKKKKEPPPAPPSGLPGVSAPTTIDWTQHLPWQPKDDMVEWKDPMKTGGGGAPTPTGPQPADAPKPGAEPWDIKGYPPKVSNDMYVYCATRFMQVMLHKPQVCEWELTQFLIDMDYPAYYAATACKTDASLQAMGNAVIQGVGPMVKTPPNKPDSELKQKVYMDLILKYPYDSGFGSFTLSRPTGETLPVLLHILEKERHPVLLRNAVFILRCFNNNEIVEPLYKQLTLTKDAVIRTRALIALARWGNPGVAKWCGQRLKGGDSFRTLCVWAVGRTALAVPVDPETVKNVLAAAQEVDAHGEFLLSAVPALGQIGRTADDETKKKIESTLLALQRIVGGIKNPNSQGGTGPGMVANPDPVGVRAKIIDEKIRISLALLGRDADVRWMDNARANLHLQNQAFFDEASDLIRKGK